MYNPVETPNLTVAKLTSKSLGGFPIYYDGVDYWLVDITDCIILVTSDVERREKRESFKTNS